MICAGFISSFDFRFSSVLATKLPKSAVIFRQRQYSCFFRFCQNDKKRKSKDEMNLAKEGEGVKNGQF
jgi:hypothetical protein